MALQIFHFSSSGSLPGKVWSLAHAQQDNIPMEEKEEKKREKKKERKWNKGREEGSEGGEADFDFTCFVQQEL